MLGGAMLHGQDMPANSPDYFENKVRPILANNCFGCHTNSAMGGLRLDSLEAMKKGGKRGVAVVPGDPENSLLVKSIRQTDENFKMPLGGKLKPAEVTVLEAWIKAGAVWPKAAAAPVTAGKTDGKYVITKEMRNFWSLRPLAEPKAPAVKDTKWAKTEIDRFILANLEKEGLHPVKAASRRDLIRRAYLDLTGLPPTAEEITAFENDKAADAFAKVVDHLLASPHYGERWGRYWLDVARFGEDDYRSLNPNPKGYRPYPNAYAYRDWVIQAFNDDMPYDQFVKAQLAGDQMDPKIRYKMLPATGFLGLGPWYYDNGSFEVTRADERHDRVDVVTRGFLGMTAACARCHDHKYDPIPQTDYYALAGVFWNTQYEEYPMAPKKVVDEFKKLEEDLDKKQKIAQEANQAVSAELSRAYAFQIANYLQGVWDVSAAKPKKEMAQVVDQRKLDYEVLDRWVKYMAKPTDKYKNKAAWQEMVKKGTAGNDEVKKATEKFQEEVIAVMLEKNELDAENKVIAAKDLDGTKPKKRTDKPSNFVSNKDFNPGSDLRLKELPEEQNNFWSEIFLREVKDSDDPNAMAGGGRQGNPGVLLFRGWALESRIGAEAQARLKAVQNDIDEVRKKLDPYYPFIHGVKDKEQISELELAIRGNPENLGPKVPRHFLSMFSEGDPVPLTKGSGRMQLAEEIVKQPIAMRVMVNRIWKGHFGTGIVDTPSNFGYGGERPTNPELLEYLASDFKKNGMSIKKLQREIMLSAVYQLSTDMDQISFDKDSGNRMYWRQNRKRMDAEQIRDSVLYVSGNLEPAMGGPSQELTPAFKERTVYGKVSRYKLDAYLQIFDFPSPSISAEKRFTTTVPLQRLFLMNSDFMQIEAEELAKRVANEPDNRSRIKKAYQYAYGRLPSEEEIAMGLEYLHTEPMREYEENKNKPQDDAAGGRGGRRRGGPGGGGPGAGGPGAGGPPTDGAAPKEGAPKGEKVISEGGKPAADGAGKPGAPVAAKPEPVVTAAAEAPAGGGGGFAGGGGGGGGMGMGMMGGMGGFGGFGGGFGRRGGAAAPVEVKYEPTAWGRYAKILLTASEFTFIN